MPWNVNQRSFVQHQLGRVQSPIPAGIYNVEVVDSRCTTDNNKHPVFRLHLKIIDGKYLDRTLFYDVRFSSQSYVAQSKAFLLACGIRKYDQLADGALVGKQLIAEAQPYKTAYEGREMNIVISVGLVED
jgi:hypothetical protein